MPRQPPKTARLQIRVSAKTKAALERAAKRAGNDLSSWARGVLVREARRG